MTTLNQKALEAAKNGYEAITDYPYNMDAVANAIQAYLQSVREYETVNYRQLLIKYILHVAISEGTTFIDDIYRPDCLFNAREQEILECLDKNEVQQLYLKHHNENN